LNSLTSPSIALSSFGKDTDDLCHFQNIRTGLHRFIRRVLEINRDDPDPFDNISDQGTSNRPKTSTRKKVFFVNPAGHGSHGRQNHSRLTFVIDAQDTFPVLGIFSVPTHR